MAGAGTNSSTSPTTPMNSCRASRSAHYRADRLRPARYQVDLADDPRTPSLRKCRTCCWPKCAAWKTLRSGTSPATASSRRRPRFRGNPKPRTSNHADPEEPAPISEKMRAPILTSLSLLALLACLMGSCRRGKPTSRADLRRRPWLRRCLNLPRVRRALPTLTALRPRGCY